MKNKNGSSKKVFNSLQELKEEYFPKTIKREMKEANLKSSESHGAILADRILEGIAQNLKQKTK